MRQDLFVEKIIKRMRRPADIVLIILMIVSAVSLIFILLLLPFVVDISLIYLAMILIPAIIYVLYRLVSGLSKEYEYSFTNDSLTIDKIVAKKRRKTLFTGSCKDFQNVMPVDSEEFEKIIGQQSLYLDVRSGAPDKDDWFIVTKYEGSTLLILLELDDRIKQQIRRFNPRAIKRL